MRPNTSSIPLKESNISLLVAFLQEGKRKGVVPVYLPKKDRQSLFIVPVFEQGGSKVLVSWVSVWAKGLVCTLAVTGADFPLMSEHERREFPHKS